MIQLIDINVSDFTKRYIPPHKRQVKFLTFLDVILSPFKTIWDEYANWRSNAVIKANVDGSSISLAWYLNQLFDPTNGIYIQNRPVNEGVAFGSLATTSYDESPNYQSLGLEATEVSAYIPFGFLGEEVGFGDCDFMVWAPSSTNSFDVQIHMTVNQYKFAGKKYKITYY